MTLHAFSLSRAAPTPARPLRPRRPAPEPSARRPRTAPPARRPRAAPALPTSPHLHSRRLALPTPRPATLSAQAATHLRKAGAGRLQQLHAASCCNNSAPAAGTSGGSATGAKDWRFFLAWYLMSLDKNPIATKAVTAAVLTLAGDLICQLRPPPDSDMGEGGEEKSFNFLQVLLGCSRWKPN
ncbi:hypothetical protein PAHAL_7G102700 [Panicum hallii]|uniref:Uncharacterized protein n=1 Tax=Panicum hallii TaxID=206008 RepID=A0A2T8IBM4_9POAL|nr:hypothetical protein PAHAL_7G102700 [Panicum hallii]